jgi:hypothetical protein
MTSSPNEIGELIGLKHWYCDSTYRYTVTDTIQPLIKQSSAPRRPLGDPKADRRRYYVLGHGSHLLDTAGSAVRSPHCAPGCRPKGIAVGGAVRFAPLTL